MVLGNQAIPLTINEDGEDKDTTSGSRYPTYRVRRVLTDLAVDKIIRPEHHDPFNA